MRYLDNDICDKDKNIDLRYSEYILNHVKKDKRKIIILDDDPTGTQTVYNIPILTKYDYDTILNEFQDNNYSAFFILTNTRAKNEIEATKINTDIALVLNKVSNTTGIEYELISRGDSTLRGHFPLEVEVLEKHLSIKINGYIVLPFFEEGNRVTIEDIHYIKDGDNLIPVGNSEFARDHTFGYTSSNLCDYIEEKTNGRIRKKDVISISLEELQTNSPTIAQKLKELNGEFCIVNAKDYSDVLKFCKVLLEVEEEGYKFLFRTAASFVKARLGLVDMPLLDGNTLSINNELGGLIIAGSYVEKTTKQIEYLIENTDIDTLLIDVSSVIKGENVQQRVAQVIAKINENIINGIDTLVYTSRNLLLGSENESSLELGNKISNFISDIIRGLKNKPAFIIAKGGITSSDVATKGLEITRAIVCGQITGGVPVWKSGAGSKFEGLIYIVFPGNIGNEKTLNQVLTSLRINRF